MLVLGIIAIFVWWYSKTIATLLTRLRTRKPLVLHMRKRVQLATEFFTALRMPTFATSIFSSRYDGEESSSGLSGSGVEVARVVVAARLATQRF